MSILIKYVNKLSKWYYLKLPTHSESWHWFCSSLIHADIGNLNIWSQLESNATSFLPTHKKKPCVSDNSFPCNSQLKCKHLNILGRMNSDHFIKANSNILRWKRHVCKVRKIWNSSSSLNGGVCCCTATVCHQSYFLQLMKHSFIHSFISKSNRSRYRSYKPLDIDWVTIKSMLQVI
jgi:hypothetical protein